MRFRVVANSFDKSNLGKIPVLKEIVLRQNSSVQWFLVG